MRANEKLVILLKEKGLKISFAESATGGMMASKIVDISGASDVLERSFVVYSNQAKIDILGVKKKDIEKYDVVSSPVASQMADGLMKISGADINVSVTGYAEGYSDEYNALVYTCIRYKDKRFIRMSQYHDETRNIVRRKVVTKTFNDIIKMIKKEESPN